MVSVIFTAGLPRDFSLLNNYIFFIILTLVPLKNINILILGFNLFNHVEMNLGKEGKSVYD